MMRPSLAYCVLLMTLPAGAAESSRLPDGTSFASWEKPLTFSKTYYVDGSLPAADDRGPGTREKPFRTIGRAAQVLEPGQRVVIAEGVYREAVHPERGGSGPDRMISYEAAPGANVVVKGSVELKNGWKPSSGWAAGPGAAKVWEISLAGIEFEGYNPFGMVNVLQDRFWLDYKRIDMTPYFRRRGMVFVDGQPVEQVDTYRQLAGGPGSWEELREVGGAGRFWVEHNGLTLHLRLPGDDSPDRHSIEVVVKEQVLAPRQRGLGYIRLKGLTLEHAANGFPVPQRGLVSTMRGHHWILQDNIIQWANAVGLDVGNEDWNASPAPECGYHVLRGNVIRYCGICGLAGFATQGMLVERNLVEWVGWQDAERMWESAGVKLHEAKQLLFRNNLVRHMRGANGVWLDCSNVNCRLTRNTLTDIATVGAALHVEGTHRENLVDNNLIAGVRGAGIFLDGTDKLMVVNNLIADCETAGISSSLVNERMIDGRGGTVRGNRILNNIFVKCGRAAIEFPNLHNEADGNVYAGMPDGYLRITAPILQCLDLEAWREFQKQDKNGQTAEMEFSLDSNTMRLRLTPKGSLVKVAVYHDLNVDFREEAAEGARIPGPFLSLIPEPRQGDPRR